MLISPLEASSCNAQHCYKECQQWSGALAEDSPRYGQNTEGAMFGILALWRVFLFACFLIHSANLLRLQLLISSLSKVPGFQAVGLICFI